MNKYPQHCVDCADGTYQAVRVDYRDVDPHGVETVVPGVEILRCTVCGAELIPAATSRHLSEEVARAHEQMTPAELFAFMERFDLNQKEVSDICGFGEKTFHRWLKGTQVVSRSMGYYLRTLRQFPEAFAWVRARGWRQPSGLASEKAPPPSASPSGADSEAPDNIVAFPALARRPRRPILPRDNPARVFVDCAQG